MLGARLSSIPLISAAQAVHVFLCSILALLLYSVAAGPTTHKKAVERPVRKLRVFRDVRNVVVQAGLSKFVKGNLPLPETQVFPVVVRGNPLL